jgi:hypothetical protein
MNEASGPIISFFQKLILGMLQYSLWGKMTASVKTI